MANLTRYNPFIEVISLRDALDRLHFLKSPKEDTIEKRNEK